MAKEDPEGRALAIDLVAGMLKQLPPDVKLQVVFRSGTEMVLRFEKGDGRYNKVVRCVVFYNEIKQAEEVSILLDSTLNSVRKGLAA